MSNPRKRLRILLGVSAGLPFVAADRAAGSTFSVSYGDGSTWHNNIYAQGFSPSIAPNPVPASAAADPTYLSRFQFFKSGLPDSASNIRVAILSNYFGDLTGLNTSSAQVVGLSTNTVASTAGLATGSPITFQFDDLPLTYGDSGANNVWGNYVAVFVNVGAGSPAPLTLAPVSALTANYVDQGGGNYHPGTNYGGETGSYWYYSVSNYYHTDSFGQWFDVFSYGGDANFAASLSTAQTSRWNNAASENWSSATNWVNGVPNAAGAPAIFSTAAGGAVSVNIDSAVVVGSIKFDNATNSYTLAGSNAITLDVTGGWAWVGVNAGNHAISAPLSPADNTEFAIASGSTLTVSDLQSTGVALLKTGAGTLELNDIRAAGMVASAGTVKIQPNGLAAGVSRVGNLTVAAGAKLDLTNNKLIATVTPVGSWNGSAYTDITGLIASGRNTGGWGGSGIVTSQSLATGGNYTSIGVARASDVRPATATATDLWAGQTITGTDTLVMYTYGGDATLDGKINIDDYVRIDSGISANLTGWSNGDFNYDGKVNIDDYTTVIDANIGNQNGVFFTGSGADSSGVSAVPEPAATSLLALGAAMIAARRKRRSR